MKLLRVGEQGKEIPAIIDSQNNLRNLSKIINDFTPENLNFEILNLKFEEFSNLIENINEEKKEVTNNQKSNMSNIHQSIILSKEKCEDLIYFVEDDYLHKLNAVSEILFAYEKFSSLINNELIICPTDYPYLYTGANDTKVFMGENRHWRKIDQTLCSFVMSKKIINNYFEELISMCKFEHYPFEAPLHEIYKDEICISPIPSLAVHCTNINSIFGISPMINVKKIWDEVADEHKDLVLIKKGGNEAAIELAEDQGIALFSATGSCDMGKALAPKVSKRLGRSLLELGGNNAAIVCKSADLDLTIKGITFSAAGTTGQRCTTLRRLFVHSDCLLYTSPSPRDRQKSRMPSSA